MAMIISESLLGCQTEPKLMKSITVQNLRFLSFVNIHLT